MKKDRISRQTLKIGLDKLEPILPECVLTVYESSFDVETDLELAVVVGEVF